MASVKRHQASGVSKDMECLRWYVEPRSSEIRNGKSQASEEVPWNLSHPRSVQFGLTAPASGLYWLDQ